MNYYFIDTIEGVFQREDTINPVLFPQWKKLTDDQVSYYLEHPNANRYEIECLGIYPEEVKPNISDYKTIMLNNLKNTRDSNMDRLLSSKDVLLVLLEAYDFGNDSRLSYYKLLAKEIVVEYDRVSNLINNASTNEEVDAAFNSNAFSTY